MRGVLVNEEAADEEKRIEKNQSVWIMLVLVLVLGSFWKRKNCWLCQQRVVEMNCPLGLENRLVGFTNL